MRRIHFVEIEDEPWCPSSIRDAATDYLQFVIEKASPYKVALPILQNALNQTNQANIVDLCAGGGGPWRSLLPELIAENSQIKVCLTDKYPNQAAFEQIRQTFSGNLSYSNNEVDASQVPTALNGFRTIFTAFHHFRPPDARGILADAVAQKQGIAIFEFTQRRWTAILAMLLTPLIVLLVTPFVRPFRPSRLFWTYLITAVQLLVCFDGIVSCLRTYTLPEMKDLTENLSEEYFWETGEIPVTGSLVPVSYLIGYPHKAKLS